MMPSRHRPSVLVATFRLSVLAAALWLPACGSADARTPIVLGATTTLEDSGMLDTLAVAFEAARPGYRLSVLTSGSGAVLEMARRGDLDVLITHLPARERRLLEAGDLSAREPIMHNHFRVVGPASDPAGVRGMEAPAPALRRIADHGALFVSRGDDSGTHVRELALWREAGLDPRAERPDWYIEAGSGMAEALLLAGQRRAYALSDRPTLRVLRNVVELEPLVGPHPALLNIYSVSSPVRTPGTDVGRVFFDWVTGAGGRAVIARFGADAAGGALFKPGAPAQLP